MGFGLGKNRIGSLNYFKCLTILGKRDEKTIANNTRLIRYEDAVAVKHWNTEILTYYADGRIKIDTHGYHTVTTKARLNHYLECGRGIGSDKGEWVLFHNGIDYVYEDGVILPDNGTINLMPKACARLNAWFEARKKNQTVVTMGEMQEVIAGLSMEDTISVWKRLRKDRGFIAEFCREDFLPVAATQDGDWNEIVSQRLAA